jgi:hypothetical protein
MDEWKSARDLLKENPNAKILDKLKISFDGLEPLQKELFLDIACFFNGAYMDRHHTHSRKFWLPSDHQYQSSCGQISYNHLGRLGMHDLLRKMGQKIVHDESAEPGKRSRLFHDKDVIHVLKHNTVSGLVYTQT